MSAPHDAMQCLREPAIQMIKKLISASRERISDDTLLGILHLPVGKSVEECVIGCLCTTPPSSLREINDRCLLQGLDTVTGVTLFLIVIHARLLSATREGDCDIFTRYIPGKPPAIETGPSYVQMKQFKEDRIANGTSSTMSTASARLMERMHEYGLNTAQITHMTEFLTPTGKHLVIQILRARRTCALNFCVGGGTTENVTYAYEHSLNSLWMLRGRKRRLDACVAAGENREEIRELYITLAEEVALAEYPTLMSTDSRLCYRSRADLAIDEYAETIHIFRRCMHGKRKRYVVEHVTGGHNDDSDQDDFAQDMLSAHSKYTRERGKIDTAVLREIL